MRATLYHDNIVYGTLLEGGYARNLRSSFSLPKQCGEARVKYGVIERGKLERDRLSWSSLYAAGRLQKPVQRRYFTSNESLLDKAVQELEKGIAANRLNGPQSLAD